jgi:hypothetical protein
MRGFFLSTALISKALDNADRYQFRTYSKKGNLLAYTEATMTGWEAEEWFRIHTIQRGAWMELWIWMEIPRKWAPVQFRVSKTGMKADVIGRRLPLRAYTGLWQGFPYRVDGEDKQLASWYETGLSTCQRPGDPARYTPGNSPLCDDECRSTAAQCGTCLHFW